MTRSLVLAVFVLVTANGYCQNLITFQSPSQNAVADALLHVSCQISSVMEISSVKATVGTEEITLVLSDSHFVGDLSLTELAPGGLTLTVTVTNVEKASFSKSVNFIYDPKPLIIFEESLSDVVARPLLTIKAKCEELDGLPCSMSVKFGAELSPNPEVLTFGNTIDTVLDLSEINGHYGLVTVTARDNRNQTTSETFRVPVEASPFLEEITKFPDPVLTLGNGKAVLFRIIG